MTLSPREHDETVVAQEAVADLYGVGQPKRRLLGNVGDLDIPTPSVADGLLDLFAGVANDDADVVDPLLFLIASITRNSTGLLATGTSCLAG